MFCLLGSFQNGIAEGEVDPSFGPLEAMRLTVITDSPVWVILSEVRPIRGLWGLYKLYKNRSGLFLLSRLFLVTEGNHTSLREPDHHVASFKHRADFCDVSKSDSQEPVLSGKQAKKVLFPSFTPA